MMGFPHLLTVASGLYLLFSRSRAQTVQTLLWNVPDGRATDLSLTFTNGVTLPLSWNNWTSTSYIDTSKSHVDLWVTSYDWNLNQYAQTLKTDIDLTVPGNYAWTIAIPDKYLSVSAKYVLRFKVPAASYNASTEDLSSPGFLVLRAAASSSPTSTSSATVTQSTSTTITTQASSTVTLTSPLSSSQPSSGLSTGAKAGIGIGVSLGALAVAALIGLMLLRKKRQRTTGELPAYAEEKRHHDVAPIAEPAELHGGERNSFLAELHGS